jgi:hypothetical protein
MSLLTQRHCADHIGWCSQDGTGNTFRFGSYEEWTLLPNLQQNGALQNSSELRLLISRVCPVQGQIGLDAHLN